MGSLKLKDPSEIVKNEISMFLLFFQKLPGNENADQLRVHDLGDQGQFQARIIKIVPLSKERNASLRIEFTGCDKGKYLLVRICPAVVVYFTQRH